MLRGKEKLHKQFTYGMSPNESSLFLEKYKLWQYCLRYVYQRKFLQNVKIKAIICLLNNCSRRASFQHSQCDCTKFHDCQSITRRQTGLGQVQLYVCFLKDQLSNINITNLSIYTCFNKYLNFSFIYNHRTFIFSLNVFYVVSNN